MLTIKKISLFLLSEKGHSVLRKIIDEGLSRLIENVIVGRDKGVVNDFFEEIVALAEEHGLPWCFRKEHVHCDVGLAISWRWIISDSACTSLYVIHDSLLPRYRGFAPLVSQLINGEKEIGATLLEASECYDEGDIVYQDKCSIQYPITINVAIQKVSDIYIRLAIQLLKTLEQGISPEATPQCESNATYSLWRDEKDYFINWRQDASEIERLIDATGFPYQGAKTIVDGSTYFVLKGLALPDVVIENRVCGKVIFIDGGDPVIVCGKGLLKILRMEDLRHKSVLPFGKFRSRFGYFYGSLPSIESEEKR